MLYQLIIRITLMAAVTVSVAAISFDSPVQSVKSSAHVVTSPDRAYSACWVDLETNPKLQQRRFIFVVDASSNKLLFTHSTFQRYTGAAWNGLSTVCAIFDAPDNANVYLWLLVKPEDSKISDWNVRAVDLEKLAARKLPDLSNAKVLRTGLDRISWESNDVLSMMLIVNNQPVTLRIPVR
jgi:hypothetical protein